MEIKPAFGTALTGIRRGMEGLERAAARVASRETMENGPEAAPLVDARIAQRNVEANVQVIKRVDETLGSLLDELA